MPRVADIERARLGSRSQLTAQRIAGFLRSERLLGPGIDPDYRRARVDELDRSLFTAAAVEQLRMELRFWRKRAASETEAPAFRATCRAKVLDLESAITRYTQKNARKVRKKRPRPS